VRKVGMPPLHRSKLLEPPEQPGQAELELAELELPAVPELEPPAQREQMGQPEVPP
jgi:hypothetical protein